MSNKDKALNYTKAANRIDEAIDNANRLAFKLNYAAALDVLSLEVTKAKMTLNLQRLKLAARDKQLENLSMKNQGKLPKQLRLSGEDIDIAVGESIDVLV